VGEVQRMSLRTTLYRTALRWQASVTLSAVGSDGSIGAVLLANALWKTVTNEMTAEERSWIERIESLRHTLAASNAQVQMLNYGTIAPDQNIPEERLATGQLVTRQIGDLARHSSQPFFNSFLQFRLIREFRPVACLELGTSLGLSTAYQAAALLCNDNGGHLTSLEGAGELAKLSRTHLQGLGLRNASVVEGRFQDTLSDVISTHHCFAWVSKDAQHTERATIGFFETILPHLDNPAILVFDDINWSQQMRRAWSTIKADRRVSIAVDLRRTGICLLDTGIRHKRPIRFPVVGEWLPYQPRSGRGRL